MQLSQIIDSIRNGLVPVHREGWLFIAAFAVAAIVLGWIADFLFWIGVALTAWCAYFFRDPPRVTPVSDDFIIAPADGKISAIGRSKPPPELELGEEALNRISIFMNVFDVHINRAPVHGRVSLMIHTAGTFANAELDKASLENERNALVIESPHGPVGVVQIAGMIARRIVTWKREGESVDTGERFGMIRFGSRVDVYLPTGATICVALGQRAIAGETLLARYDGAPVHPVTRVG